MGEENSGTTGIRSFECYNDPATLGTRWTRCLTAFTFHADGKGLIIEDLRVDNDDNAVFNTFSTTRHFKAQSHCVFVTSAPVRDVGCSPRNSRLTS
jgi:hypothetical protein